MKALLIFLAVLLAIWQWRNWRAAQRRAREDAARSKPTTTDMVLCRHCGVHIPANEAVTGLQGQYCSNAHRLAMEP